MGKRKVLKGLTLVFVISIALLALTGCGAKPDAVATKLAEAVNTQDLDAALKLFAEDAVVNTGGPTPFSGKEEIQGWLEGITEVTFQDGKIVAETWTATDETLAALQAAMAALPETGGEALPIYAMVMALGGLSVAGGLGVEFLRRYSRRV